ncbi:PAS domain-containing sensor histidine kinase, partial [Mycobacterium tuberculosis]
WLYQSTRPLSVAELDSMRRDQQYGMRAGFPAVPWKVEREEAAHRYLVRTDIGGRPRQFLAVDERLPDLGWTLTVMADHSEVAVARERAW